MDRGVLSRMRRYPSGQRGQTVNLLTSVFVGSNPTRRTRPEKAGSVLAVFPAQDLTEYMLYSSMRSTEITLLLSEL